MKYRVECEYEGGFAVAADVERLLNEIAENVEGFKVLRHSELKANGRRLKPAKGAELLPPAEPEEA